MPLAHILGVGLRGEVSGRAHTQPPRSRFLWLVWERFRMLSPRKPLQHNPGTFPGNAGIDPASPFYQGRQCGWSIINIMEAGWGMHKKLLLILNRAVSLMQVSRRNSKSLHFSGKNLTLEVRVWVIFTLRKCMFWI